MGNSTGTRDLPLPSEMSKARRKATTLWVSDAATKSESRRDNPPTIRSACKSPPPSVHRCPAPAYPARTRRLGYRDVACTSSNNKVPLHSHRCPSTVEFRKKKESAWELVMLRWMGLESGETAKVAVPHGIDMAGPPTDMLMRTLSSSSNSGPHTSVG